MNLKELAEQCGIGYLMDPNDEFFVGGALSELAKKIATEERNECIKVCEGLMEKTDWKAEKGRYNDCIVAIMARSNEQGNAPRDGACLG